VLPPGEVKVSRSLRQRLRACGWDTTVDAAFPAVVEACSRRGSAEGTWITGRMRAAYTRLHELGWAHSLEVWDQGELIGGLYGVQLGAVFTGESMFHRATDASKIALVDLAERFGAAGGILIDVQITTDHLATLGARDVARSRFLATLARGRDNDVRLPTERLPVGRLAGGGRGGSEQS
jgi:leucyl/phenylalanyl-tRNA--protein transferase